jgi:thiol-disulfide isomerase/thioredoxin
MKALLLPRSFFFLCTFLFYLTFVPSTYAIPFFTGTYEQALSKSRNENKKLLLYFTAKWCGPCRYMEKNVFDNDSVTTAFGTEFLALKIDADAWTSKPLLEEFYASALPTFVILTSEGVVERRTEGRMSVAQFSAFLSPPPGATPVYVPAPGASREEYMQEQLARKRWKVDPGVRIGPNFTQAYRLPAVGRPGLDVGLLVDFFKNRVSFRPGLTLSARQLTLPDNRTLRARYLELPVQFSYLLRKATLLGLSGGYRADLSAYGASLLRKNDFIRPTDFGTRIGLSAFVGSTSRLELQVGYQLGLQNVAIQAGQTSYNRGPYLGFMMFF